MKIDVKFSSEISDSIAQLGNESEIYVGLETALTNFESAIAFIPDQMKTVVLGNVTLKSLGSDKQIAIAQLFNQVSQMMEVYFHVLGCNYTSLTKGVVRSLNEFEYTTSMLCTRALVEHMAIAESRISEVEKIAAPLTKLRASEIRRLIKSPEIATVGQTIFDLIHLLNLCFGAGRFNRDALKDHRNLLEIELSKDNPMRQIGVMDAIDKLVWTGPLIPATSSRYYYELLCDYVHPNVGANIMFVEEEKLNHFVFPNASENTFVVDRLTAILPRSKSMRLHVMQVAYLPLRETLVTITNQIKRLGSLSLELSEICYKLREIGISPIVRKTN